MSDVILTALSVACEEMEKFIAVDDEVGTESIRASLRQIREEMDAFAVDGDFTHFRTMMRLINETNTLLEIWKVERSARD